MDLMGHLGKRMLAGDFNAILDSADKKGGRWRVRQSQNDFKEFVEDNGLIDIIPDNGKYTWTNRRDDFTNIAERLD